MSERPGTRMTDLFGRAKRAVPYVALGAGALAMALGLAAGPAAADGSSSVVTALQSYGNGTVTYTVTPVTSAPSGAWVSIMNPTTGFAFTPRTFVNTPLVAGQPTNITVPLTIPGGSVLQGFNFLEIPAGGNQAVVLAAETQAVTPIVPPPVVPPPTVPPTITTIPTPTPHPTSTPTPIPIPSVPPKGGSSQQTVTLPKTGAGPTLEIVGLLLFVAGGLLLVLRPRQH